MIVTLQGGALDGQTKSVSDGAAEFIAATQIYHKDGKRFFPTEQSTDKDLVGVTASVVKEIYRYDKKTNKFKLV